MEISVVHSPGLSSRGLLIFFFSCFPCFFSHASHAPSCFFRAWLVHPSSASPRSSSQLPRNVSQHRTQSYAVEKIPPLMPMLVRVCVRVLLLCTRTYAGDVAACCRCFFFCLCSVAAAAVALHVYASLLRLGMHCIDFAVLHVLFFLSCFLFAACSSVVSSMPRYLASFARRAFNVQTENNGDGSTPTCISYAHWYPSR